MLAYRDSLVHVTNLRLGEVAFDGSLKLKTLDNLTSVKVPPLQIEPMERIDIAIIPGLAFDEKGGRIGSGRGYYDRLIPKLAITTRKVALTFEEQIIPQIPMESHDKHVDIIITEKRVIYKI